ncbi:transglycosylase SLT domain-containing protein [Neisseriaceae bacterium PsAf]|nr:transglycosylase SLT domain-containing protein [Neisseriaceae bacterium PsAf]
MRQIRKFVKWVPVLGLLFGQYHYAANSQAQKQTALDSEVSQNIEGYIIFLNAQPLSKNAQSKNIDPNLVNQLTKMFHLGNVRPDLTQKYEDAFIAHPEYFNQTLVRSAPYMHFIVNEVARRNMPGEIVLLPFIESRFTPSVKSHAGAKGIWQFMPATGKQYGLDLTNLYDGRDDFYAATMAALDYLEYLYSLFGDWPLAIAAYNAGENRVQKAIDEAQAKGLYPSFDNLRLPKETTNYVPKLLAVRNIIRNHKAYNLSVANLANKPYFENVKINHPIALQTIAQLANVPLSEIQNLNPSYKAAIYVPNNNRNLLIPRSSYRRFFDNYNRMIKKDQSSWYALKIQNSQTIGEISSALNIPVADLQSYNNLGSGVVPAGKTIFFRLPKGNNISELVSDQFSVLSLNDFESPLSFSKKKSVRIVYNKSNKVSGPKSKNSGIIKVSNKKSNGKKKVVQTTKKNNNTKNAKKSTRR